MDKSALITAILDHLKERYETLARASQAARTEATHSESKSEGKYDTRGLEAGYLANGQAMQAEEVKFAMEELQSMELRDFSGGGGIGLGALVEIDFSGEREWYFLGPSTAGAEVTMDGCKVTVISMQAPLARQLVGKREGERANPVALIRAVS